MVKIFLAEQIESTAIAAVMTAKLACTGDTGLVIQENKISIALLMIATSALANIYSHSFVEQWQFDNETTCRMDFAGALVYQYFCLSVRHVFNSEC